MVQSSILLVQSQHGDIVIGRILILIEGSLEVKLPTNMDRCKAEQGRGAERRGRLEERRVEEKE